MYRFTLLLLGLGALGCTPSSSEPALYPATGTVSIGGHALAGGKVEFRCTDRPAQRAEGEIQSDGRFRLVTVVDNRRLIGAMEGTYRAIVHAPTGPDQSWSQSIAVPGTFTVTPDSENRFLLSLRPGTRP
jgi:hypothetical protein